MCECLCWRDGERVVTASSHSSLPLALSLPSLLPAQPLSAFALQFLNGVGDLLDLVPALTPRSNSSAGAGAFRMPGMGHCTALIKVRPNSFGSGHEGALGKPRCRSNEGYCRPLSAGVSSLKASLERPFGGRCFPFRSFS